MAIGPAVRQLLGASLGRRAGRLYRRIFVDLQKESDALAALIPANSHVLDVGGGDGEPLNHLLARRPDIRVTTIDSAPLVGQWVDSRFADRVLRLPSTTVSDYLRSGREYPDVVLMADMLHHVRKGDRTDLIRSFRVMLDRVPTLRMIVKDVEPGFWRARLGYWSDRYITGDANVSPISREGVELLFQDALGPLRRERTGLFDIDRPNYAVAYFR